MIIDDESNFEDVALATAALQRALGDGLQILHRGVIAFGLQYAHDCAAKYLVLVWNLAPKGTAFGLQGTHNFYALQNFCRKTLVWGCNTRIVLQGIGLGLQF